MRFTTLVCLMALSGLACAAEDSMFTHRPSSFRLGFEEIKLPGDEAMGMVGASYLLETLPNLYQIGRAHV